MSDIDPRFTERRMLILAGRAIGKIDVGGPRGTRRVTHEEIEAMASTLVCLGLCALSEGEGNAVASGIPDRGVLL